MIASATPIPEAFCDKVGASGASSSSAGETTAPPSSTLSSVSSRLKPFRRIARALRMQGTSFSRSLCDAAMPATPRSRQTMPRTARNGDVSSSWNTSQPHRNDVTMPTPHQMPGPAAAPKYWIAGHANSCVRVKMSAPSAPKASPSLRNRGTSRPWPMQASEKLTKLVPRVTNPWTRKMLGRNTRGAKYQYRAHSTQEPQRILAAHKIDVIHRKMEYFSGESPRLSPDGRPNREKKRQKGHESHATGYEGHVSHFGGGLPIFLLLYILHTMFLWRFSSFLVGGIHAGA
eukprot:scaffold743_cov267-Pinguiococcus_pyrenoidosus.AAC.4